MTAEDVRAQQFITAAVLALNGIHVIQLFSEVKYFQAFSKICLKIQAKVNDL